MKRRIILGIAFIFIGLLIFLISSFFGIEAFTVSMIYALPLIILGFIIMFNHKEDEIEQINYPKLKRGKNNGKK